MLSMIFNILSSSAKLYSTGFVVRRYHKCAAKHKDMTIPFTNPAFRDESSELAREGAQRIIRQVEEAEPGAFLEEHASARDGRRRRVVVRNSYLPWREVLTGVGPVRVRVPRTQAGVSTRSRCRPYLIAFTHAGRNDPDSWCAAASR